MNVQFKCYCFFQNGSPWNIQQLWFFRGVRRIYIIRQLQLTNNMTLSLLHMQTKKVAVELWAVFLKEYSRLEASSDVATLLLVNSSGTIYHNLHGLHINAVITRNATYISASREFGIQTQNFSAKGMMGRDMMGRDVVSHQQYQDSSSNWNLGGLTAFSFWTESREKNVVPGERGDGVSRASGSSEHSSVQQEFQQTVWVHTHRHSLPEKEAHHINHRPSPAVIKLA